MLGIWTHLETVFNRHTIHGYKMQIVRVQTAEGRKLVGESVCVCVGVGVGVGLSVCCAVLCYTFVFVALSSKLTVPIYSPGIEIPLTCVNDLCSTLMTLVKQITGEADADAL